MRRTVFSFLAIAAVACAFGTAAKAFDQIILSDGSPYRPEIKLQVTAETYDKVSWKGAGIEGGLNQSQVKEIRWGDKPDEFRNGEVAYVQGEYDRAINLFRESLKSRKGRDWWVNPYSLYYLGSSLAQTGKLDDAEEQYRELLDKYPDAKFAPQAYIDLGDIYLAKGEPQKALESYKKITEAVDEITLLPKYGNDIYQKARSKTADAYIAMKDYEAALDALKSLLNDIKVKMPELALSVEQKQAHVLVLQGDLDAGVRAYNSIIDNTISKVDGASSQGETELYGILAQCYNGLGDAYQSKSQYKDALMQYLRVVTVLADSAPAEYAHALEGAAKCFEETGMKDRADALRAELKKRFPNNK